MIRREKLLYVLTITYCNGVSLVRRIRYYSPDAAKESAMRWYRSCPQATAIRVQFEDGREVVNVVRMGGVK